MKWHIGCSGFSYKEWKGVFYPPKLPQREWFIYYSSKFSTLELNVSFYRFPTLAMLQNWYDKSPPGFLFAVKAPKLITHFRQMLDCEKWLTDFYTVCREALKEKQGPLLFQFPGRFTYTEERLQRITGNLDTSVVNVVEFRHASWWDKKVYKALEKKGIVFCGSSFPGLPEEVIRTAPTLYYRFHGMAKLFYSKYKPAELRKIGSAMQGKKKINDVYCYFNNTAAVAAIENAVWLEKFALKKTKKP